jgi:hypothetical protein
VDGVFGEYLSHSLSRRDLELHDGAVPVVNLNRTDAAAGRHPWNATADVGNTESNGEEKEDGYPEEELLAETHPEKYEGK